MHGETRLQREGHDHAHVFQGGRGSAPADSGGFQRVAGGKVVQGSRERNDRHHEAGDSRSLR